MSIVIGFLAMLIAMGMALSPFAMAAAREIDAQPNEDNEKRIEN